MTSELTGKAFCDAPSFPTLQLCDYYHPTLPLLPHVLSWLLYPLPPRYTGNHTTLGGKRSDIETRLDGQSRKKDILGNERLSHPYYWAPFILIGNGL